MPSMTAQQAVEAALKRASSDNRGHLERLPTEVKLLIVGEMLAALSAINLALSGPDYYAVVMQHEAEIAEKIVISRIGSDLMPLAATFYNYSNFKHSLFQVPEDFDYEGALDNYFDQYLSSDSLHSWPAQSQITKLSIANDYCETHAVIEGYTEKLASKALANAWEFYGIETVVEATTKHLTHTEMIRFNKALYIIEIASPLFPRIPNEDDLPFGFSPVFARDVVACVMRLWQRFAPWELQQVRCVQRLLSGHIQTVLNTQYDGATERYQCSTDERQLGNFLADYGLIAFKGVLLADRTQANPKSPPEGLAEAREALTRISQLHEKFHTRYIPFYTFFFIGQDGLYFEPDENLKVNLDAQGIFDKYPEEECGPKESWYHTLLQLHSDDEIFSYASKRQFRCLTCMLNGGYAFWDRDTLKRWGGVALPTIEEMLKVGRDLEIDDLALHLCRGVYPKCLGEPGEQE
ncbi:hypothetical protein F5Y19DRAFT_486154 [Xylariaceae sp. FL1651]|nr:hypothetical protein F5Y19DRAFT_486154 [Xylariaceae sp. FL1651]